MLNKIYVDKVTTDLTSLFSTKRESSDQSTQSATAPINTISGGSRLPWEDATSPSTSPKLGVSGPSLGERDLEDESDISGDNATQLFTIVTAVNNAQAIVTTLSDKYDNIFDDDQTLQSPLSLEMYPQMGDNGNEGSTDDEVMHMRDNRYHDA
eukprot:Gb_06375 [translate_table: standard]